MIATSRRTALVAGMLALGLAACSNTEGPVSASTTKGESSKSDLAARSEMALNDLYAKPVSSAGDVAVPFGALPWSGRSSGSRSP